MKLLKLFETNAERESFVFTADNTPNVNFCEEDGSVGYEKKVETEPAMPNNEIWYEASEKLVEKSIPVGNGLYINGFNTPIITHTFADGKGKIVFGEDVTEIKGGAFYGTLITSIMLPNTITKLDGAGGQFGGNPDLTNIYCKSINEPAYAGSGVFFIGNPNIISILHVAKGGSTATYPSWMDVWANLGCVERNGTWTVVDDL